MSEAWNSLKLREVRCWSASLPLCWTSSISMSKSISSCIYFGPLTDLLLPSYNFAMPAAAEEASLRSLELVEARRGEMLICLTIGMLDEFNVLCWTPTHITIFYYLPLTYYTISSHQTKFNCLFQVSCHYLSSLLPQPLPCAPTSIPNDLLLAIITVATFKLDMYYLFLRHS